VISAFTGKNKVKSASKAENCFTGKLSFGACEGSKADSEQLEKDKSKAIYSLYLNQN
jgi:signal transduction histidine kinase